MLSVQAARLVAGCKRQVSAGGGARRAIRKHSPDPTCTQLNAKHLTNLQEDTEINVLVGRK